MFDAAILNLMARLIPRYMQALTEVSREGNDLFSLAMIGLTAPELPLRSSAAHFWVRRNVSMICSSNRMLGDFRATV